MRLPLLVQPLVGLLAETQVGLVSLPGLAPHWVPGSAEAKLPAESADWLLQMETASYRQDLAGVWLVLVILPQTVEEPLLEFRGKPGQPVSVSATVFVGTVPSKQRCTRMR